MCQPLRSAFGPWAEPWSRLGLWLSLWDERGEHLHQDAPANPFWHALSLHSQRFQNRLRHLARQAQQGDLLTGELDPAGGAVAIAMPLHHRHRVIGSLLACGLTRGLDDGEAFARFCTLYEVDRLVFERLAADVPRCEPASLQAYAGILAHQAESFGTARLALNDVHDLSTHLARVYEELHLIYRVGMTMTVSTPPVTHFEKLCEELVASTVVESFAVVLEPPAGTPDKPAVVRLGPLQVPTEEILRLYRQVRDLPRNAGPAFVTNHPRAVAELAWTSPWLRQCVFCELCRNNLQFGGILAMNHIHGQDFASYEIQLLNAITERSAAFMESVHLYEDLERLFIGMLHALVSSIDAKDEYTCGHSQRVAWLSRHIAALNHVPQAQCRRVYLSALLHDIGKIGISEQVLGKTGRLTREEFEEMKRHPAIGAHILEGVPTVEDLIPGVLRHHERPDGKGYPDGLKGDEIPLLGRIIGLADSFDAMTTNRTYRRARPLQIAISEIRRYAGTQFDAELADLLVRQDLKAIGRQMADFGEQPIRTLPWIAPNKVRGEGI